MRPASLQALAARSPTARNGCNARQIGLVFASAQQKTGIAHGKDPSGHGEKASIKHDAFQRVEGKASASYARSTFSACRPLGPFLTSKDTLAPSSRERSP